MKKYMFLFLCLIGNVGNCQENVIDICWKVSSEKNNIVSQSEISEFIFGVRRDLSEVKEIDKVLNSIYLSDYNYKDFVDFKSCLNYEKSRFIARNKVIFILAIIGRIKIDKMNISEIDNVLGDINFIEFSEDRIKMVELVNAIKIFRDDWSVGKLKNMYDYYGYDYLIIKREIISSLHFIGSDLSLKAIDEINSKNDNEIIRNDIDSLFIKT
ncbi:hypothetical protein GTG28_00680 [Vibrio sp. OCN044]|uniref:DUF4476 domain-containing protein n=1 Tax=Vibrio tetraodonis subsp. pristinus TaxID=2695891 RepID=A0A6L8LP25_9VIBR|nr:hypothetical protein [Vibrio tetraodonis]MYM57748.1 hypothetical protein [Vibrio tetraodonis subsp. pristinus]